MPKSKPTIIDTEAYFNPSKTFCGRVIVRLLRVVSSDVLIDTGGYKMTVQELRDAAQEGHGERMGIPAELEYLPSNEWPVLPWEDTEYCELEEALDRGEDPLF